MMRWLPCAAAAAAACTAAAAATPPRLSADRNRSSREPRCCCHTFSSSCDGSNSRQVNGSTPHNGGSHISSERSPHSSSGNSSGPSTSVNSPNLSPASSSSAAAATAWRVAAAAAAAFYSTAASRRRVPSCTALLQQHLPHHPQQICLRLDDEQRGEEPRQTCRRQQQQQQAQRLELRRRPPEQPQQEEEETALQSRPKHEQHAGDPSAEGQSWQELPLLPERRARKKQGEQQGERQTKQAAPQQIEQQQRQQGGQQKQQEVGRLEGGQREREQQQRTPKGYQQGEVTQQREQRQTEKQQQDHQQEGSGMFGSPAGDWHVSYSILPATERRYAYVQLAPYGVALCTGIGGAEVAEFVSKELLWRLQRVAWGSSSSTSKSAACLTSVPANSRGEETVALAAGCEAATAAEKRAGRGEEGAGEASAGAAGEAAQKKALCEVRGAAAGTEERAAAAERVAVASAAAANSCPSCCCSGVRHGMPTDGSASEQRQAVQSDQTAAVPSSPRAVAGEAAACDRSESAASSSFPSPPSHSCSSSRPSPCCSCVSSSSPCLPPAAASPGMRQAPPAAPAAAADSSPSSSAAAGGKGAATPAAEEKKGKITEARGGADNEAASQDPPLPGSYSFLNSILRQQRHASLVATINEQFLSLERAVYRLAEERDPRLLAQGCSVCAALPTSHGLLVVTLGDSGAVVAVREGQQQRRIKKEHHTRQQQLQQQHHLQQQGHLQQRQHLQQQQHPQQKQQAGGSRRNEGGGRETTQGVGAVDGVEQPHSAAAGVLSGRTAAALPAEAERGTISKNSRTELASPLPPPAGRHEDQSLAAASLYEICEPLVAWRLAEPHTTENDVEMARIRRMHPDANPQHLCNAESLLKGYTRVTRALGAFHLKEPSAHARVSCLLVDGSGSEVQQPYGSSPAPYLTCAPDCTLQPLHDDVEAVIIGSSGFWQLLSPEEAVRALDDFLLEQHLAAGAPQDHQAAAFLLRHALLELLRTHRGPRSYSREARKALLSRALVAAGLAHHVRQAAEDVDTELATQALLGGKAAQQAVMEKLRLAHSKRRDCERQSQGAAAARRNGYINDDVAVCVLVRSACGRFPLCSP